MSDPNQNTKQNKMTELVRKAEPSEPEQPYSTEAEEKPVAASSPILEETPKQEMPKPAEECETASAAAEHEALEGPEPPDEAAAPGVEEPKGKKGHAALPIAIMAAFVLVLLGCVIGSLGHQQSEEAKNIESSQTQRTPAAQQDGSASSAVQDTSPAEAPTVESATACEHEWEPEAETRHVDAVTKEVTVPGVEYTETEYHTLCNVCKEQIDGKVAEHDSETGHSGATTNVPIKVTKKTPDTTATEEVEAAYDVRVWSKERCSKCGEERDVSEQIEKIG